MENNINDIINKFNNILKEKDIDLGKVLEDEPQTNNFDFEFDLETIIKLKQVFSQINDTNNPRNCLLRSLKPFLRKERKEKLEQYIKIANLLSVVTVLNDKSGDKQ